MSEPNEGSVRRREARTSDRSILEAWSAFLRDRYLSLDVRWLGLFRIGLGTLLSVEVLRRWYYAKPFYTNDGLLPNHYSLFAPMGRNVFSIYHAFSSYGEVSLAFALTLLVFLTFTLGYRTRLFHALSALCITSLNARNLFVENGGTVVVNILTLYTLFLPLGARFSLDAVRESLHRRPDRSVLDLNRPDPLNAPARVSSLVVLLLLVQWSCIYFFNTVQKDGAGWRDGSALYWFFQQDRIVTPFGIWARNHLPFPLVRVMTYGALCIEGSLSVLILFPFAQKWTRRAVLALHGDLCPRSPCTSTAAHPARSTTRTPSTTCGSRTIGGARSTTASIRSRSGRTHSTALPVASTFTKFSTSRRARRELLRARARSAYKRGVKGASR